MTASTAPRRLALVTGASSGIGLAYARLLASHGYDLVAVARRANRLESVRHELAATSGTVVHPLVADLSQPEGTALIADYLDRRELRVSYLVNNAGYSLMGPFATTPWEDEQRFFTLMTLAPIELTRRLMPAMLSDRFGRIVNIASAAAYLSGTPNMSLYCAAKSFMIKFTEGLAAEARPHGVLCTASVPGFTDTEIFDSTGVSRHVTGHPLMRAALMHPRTVARQAYGACERGDIVIVHGWHHRVWVATLSHAPKAARYRLSAFSKNVGLD